ncbi:MAG: hypothetical protein JO022_02400, partial [Acidobacteriaceae bacterium]|nr:hypothetical protein [Acidobacteriaceae bacterium]
MSPLVLLLCFFTVVMGSVVIAGYLLGKRSTAAASANVADPDAQEMLPKILQRVGETMPGAKKSRKLDRQLLLAGYRHPDAANIFAGIRIASALTLAIFALIAKMIF